MPERPASQVVALAQDLARRKGRSGGSGGRGAGAAQPVVRVGAPVRSARAVSAAAAVRRAVCAGRPYYGEVAATDAALAPLLDELRAAPRPTLVIVTGDHGEGLGDHGELSHGLFAYESTLRVPLIIAEVGNAKAAKRAKKTRRFSFCGLSGFAFPSASAAGGKSRPSPRGTSTSCRRSSTRWGRRRPPICRGDRCCRPRSGARARRRGRRTSRRWARCSIAAGRRSPACWPIATSSSTCRSPSATTSRPIRRSA